jgi:hypothetical protein
MVCSCHSHGSCVGPVPPAAPSEDEAAGRTGPTSLTFSSRATGQYSGEIVLLPTGSYRPAALNYLASVMP